MTRGGPPGQPSAGPEAPGGSTDPASPSGGAEPPSPSGETPAAPRAASATAPGESAAPPTGALRRALSSRRAPRLRAGIAAFLVAAALLGVAASTLALWSRHLVFDEDAFVAVVAPAAGDPAVRSSVAAYVAARAVQAADLSDRFGAALPPGARITAPALTRALQRFLENEIEKFLATGVAHRLWEGIARTAHRQLVGALRDQDRRATTGSDDVTLDLVPLVAVALQRLEAEVPGLLGRDVTLPPIDPTTAPRDMRTLLQDALGRRLPAGFGTVTLVGGGRGNEVKRALERFDDLVILVVALTAALVAAALLVSVHRRRTALWLGLGALLVFALARVLEAQLAKAAVGGADSSEAAAVARSVLAAAVSSLDAYFIWVAAAGAVVAAAALLAARPAWLQTMGRAFSGLFGVASDLPAPETRAGRWMHEHLDLLRVAGVVAAVALLLLLTGSVAGVAAVVLGLVVYELALTTFAAGMPRERRQERDAGPGTGDAQAGDGDAETGGSTPRRDEGEVNAGPGR